MKRNNILALSGVVLASALAGNSVSALNVDGNGIVTNTSAITVNNVADPDDAFVACKIVDIKYNESDNTVDFAFTSNFKNWQNSLPDGNSYKDLTVEDYSKLADGTASGIQIGYKNETEKVDELARLDVLAGALASNSSFVSGCTSMTTSGTSATATVSYGAHLIVPIARTDDKASYAYGTTVVNNLVKGNGTDYELDDTQATVNAKSAKPGTVSKTVDKTSYYRGENVTFKIGTVLPQFPANASNKSFGVRDTMEEGLDFVDFGTITSGGNTLTVSDGKIMLGSEEVGTVSQSGQVIEFVFNDASVTPSPEISYVAKLNDKSTLGDKKGDASVNENSASLLSPKSYYAENPGWEVSDPSVATAYTYGIEVEVVDKDDHSKVLANAKFEICLDEACEMELGEIDMSQDNGEFFESLGEGTYYLKETKVPAGYKKPTVVFPISISKDDANDNGYVKIQIENEKAILSLPFTGGRGVIVYAIAGVTIVATVSVIYVSKKKQRA